MQISMQCWRIHGRHSVSRIIFYRSQSVTCIVRATSSVLTTSLCLDGWPGIAFGGVCFFRFCYVVLLFFISFFIFCCFVTSDKGGSKCVCPSLPAFACLSVCLYVCLLARLLKNAWMDLDEILRVDRCHTDELITFEPDPDHSPDSGTGFTPEFLIWFHVIPEWNSNYTNLLKFLVVSWNNWFHTFTVTYTLCLKKGCHFYFCNNFGKCRPSLILLSLLYSQIYCWGRWYRPGK